MPLSARFVSNYKMRISTAQTIDPAIALSREDAPLSARFDSSCAARVSTAQTGADLRRQMTDNAIALSREDVPLSARFDSSCAARVSTAQTGADLCRAGCEVQQHNNRIKNKFKTIPYGRSCDETFRTERRCAAIRAL